MGREHPRSAHHSERTGSDRRSSNGMGVSLEGEDDSCEVRQYGSGGHSELRLLTQPSGNELNEMPNIHGGFPRVPDQDQHIRRAHNTIADALSRNNLPLYRSSHPQARLEATQIPAAVLDLILLREPD